MITRPITFGEAAALEGQLPFELWRSLTVATLDYAIAQIHAEISQEDCDAAREKLISIQQTLEL